MGDFPAETYSWYYGWEVLRKYVPNIPKTASILVPGIGNDPILLDLLAAGYHHLTAQDYSEHAMERQRDLLLSSYSSHSSVTLSHGDVRQLPDDWSPFDVILEKGLLDAIYLSGDGQVERAVESLSRVLKPGGLMVSVSGVVPEDLRRALFSDWEWLRDGSADLQAGCFLWRQKDNDTN